MADILAVPAAHVGAGAVEVNEGAPRLLLDGGYGAALVYGAQRGHEASVAAAQHDNVDVIGLGDLVLGNLGLGAQPVARAAVALDATVVGGLSGSVDNLLGGAARAARATRATAGATGSKGGGCKGGCCGDARSGRCSAGQEGATRNGLAHENILSSGRLVAAVRLAPCQPFPVAWAKH